MRNLTKRAFLSAVGGGLFYPLSGFAQNLQQLSTAPLRGDSIDSLLTKLGSGIRLPFVMRGARDTYRLALTFDDGPTPGVTDRILDILASSGAKATFFMIGQRVKANPQLARRVRNEGHELANHSYTHPDLAKLSDIIVRSELEKTQKVIEDICGVSPRYFRPPYGSFRSTQGTIAREFSLQVIIWSVDPQDWRKPGAQVIASRITSASTGGDIVLCHDLHPETAAATKIFTPVISGKFQLVTLGNLLVY